MTGPQNRKVKYGKELRPFSEKNKKNGIDLSKEW